jgi:Mg2+ and Co2+ transporter CorA
MKMLEEMQNEFREWLRKAEKQINKEEIEIKKLTENKLIEIANKHDYVLSYRNTDLGKDNLLLVFQNKNNKKFISAWVDEEGFSNEELENL